MILAILYFNQDEGFDIIDATNIFIVPIILYIIAYSFESRKLKYLLNYIQYTKVELIKVVNKYSLA